MAQFQEFYTSKKKFLGNIKFNLQLNSDVLISDVGGTQLEKKQYEFFQRKKRSTDKEPQKKEP